MYVASSEAAVVVGFAVIFVCWRLKIHRDENSRIHKKRIVSITALCFSLYTFGVLVYAQLVHKVGPQIDQLIREGFGNERIGWLLLIVCADLALRLWDTVDVGMFNRAE